MLLHYLTNPFAPVNSSKGHLIGADEKSQVKAASSLYQAQAEMQFHICCTFDNIKR